MTTIPVLMMLGNRLCMSLLKESQLALEDADWKYVSECLQEFRSQFDRHTQAEVEVLYPRLAALSRSYEAMTLELRSGQADIAMQTQHALLSSAHRKKLPCAGAVARLMALLGDYWECERRLFSLVTQEVENEVLLDLAEKLKASLDAHVASSGPGAGKGDPRLGRRLH